MSVARSHLLQRQIAVNGASLVLLGCVAMLTLLGLVVLFSAGRVEADSASIYMKKQSIWLVPAGIGFLIAWRIDLERMRQWVWPIGLVTLVLLVLVLIPGIGSKVNGARRWINLGFANMQVSDFAKIGMVFVLAHYLALNQRVIQTFGRGFLLPSMVFGVVGILVLLQPDYGTAFLCVLVGAVMLFLAGARLLYLIPTGLVGLALFSAAIWYDPVRMRRIFAFLDVEGNKGDSAYQLWQGMLAFGAGGLRGTGLGNGRQQLAFLPEAHTDFIFPIIGEELGFFFSAGVVIAFMVIFVVVLVRLRRAPNLFHFLLAIGLLLFLTLQALINFGVVTGLLPTKGMSLPFISYGGSNLLVMFILVGFLCNCFRVWNRPPLLAPREGAL